MKHFTIDNETSNITLHTSAQEAEGVATAESFATEAELANLAGNWPAARLIEIWNSLPGATPVTRFKDRKTAVSRIWKAIQSLGEAAQAETSQPEAEPVTETAQDTETAPEPEAASPVTSDTPEAEVPAPAAPQTAHVATDEAPAANDATPASDAPAAAPDQKLLRILERAFEGLSPEQRDAKWEALKNALAARKTPVAASPKAAKTEAAREGSKTSQVIAMLKREGGVTLEEIMSAMDWQKHTTRAMLSAGGSLVKKHGLVIVSEKLGDKRIYSLKA